MMHRIALVVVLLIPSTVSALTDEAYFARIDTLESEISRVERTDGPFSDQLFEPLVSLAELYISEGDFESATDAVQRAQNISHRNDGVYTPRQLALISMLTNMALADGDYDAANRQEKFRFFVTTHYLEKTDPEILFAFADMAEWYINTGQSRRARRLLKEAMTVADRLDRNPLPLAILMNKARRLEGLNTNPRELVSVLESIEKSDRDTLIDAYMEAADSLLISRKDQQAADYFRKATEMSALAGDSEPQPITIKRALKNPRVDQDLYRFEQNYFGRQRLERMTREEVLEDVALEPQWFLVNADQTQRGFNVPDSNQRPNQDSETERLVGDPLMFSEEQLSNILSSSSRKRMHELRIEASFTVRTDGDLTDIEIVDSTAPIKLDRLIMEALRRTYYRPALENGVPVERRNVKLIQTFDSTFPGA